MCVQLQLSNVDSRMFLPIQHKFLIHPFMITIATDKDQRQRIRLCDITLKEDGLMMSTITTVRLITPGQGGVITDGRGDGM